MVMVTSLGSPLCVCAVGEGPFSLNCPQSHYPDHLTCSILRVGRQWLPACVFCPCIPKVFILELEEDAFAGL